MLILEKNMAINRHSSWQDIRLWKQGWTVAINHMDGGIWWQRLNECKRHQSASDYCNCHQIPSRPLTGHADPLAPPHTHISHHQHSSTLHTTGALPGTPMNVSGHTHAVHLSFHTCRKFFPVFFIWVKCPVHRRAWHGSLTPLSRGVSSLFLTRSGSMFVDL